jgi:hypothetical protein
MGKSRHWGCDNKHGTLIEIFRQQEVLEGGSWFPELWRILQILCIGDTIVVCEPRTQGEL